MLGILMAAVHSPLSALDVPERPRGYVTDKAGVLSTGARLKLEALLGSYEAETTNQVVVAIFDSLEGGSIEDFSIRLAEKWKAGQKGRGNGVIFLSFIEDRKMRIEVGYGLEGALPDALAGQIVQTRVAPLFKKGDYEAGILFGVAAIIGATKGEYDGTGSHPVTAGPRELTPQEQEMLRRQGEALAKLIFFAALVLFVIDFFRYRSYVGQHELYKGRYTFWEWWFRFAILLFVLSMLFRILFYVMLFSRGGYYGGRGGSGGFRGGGGGFGGGGASGSW